MRDEPLSLMIKGRFKEGRLAALLIGDSGRREPLVDPRVEAVLPMEKYQGIYVGARIQRSYAREIWQAAVDDLIRTHGPNLKGLNGRPPIEHLAGAILKACARIAEERRQKQEERNEATERSPTQRTTTHPPAFRRRSLQGIWIYSPRPTLMDEAGKAGTLGQEAVKPSLRRELMRGCSECSGPESNQRHADFQSARPKTVRDGNDGRSSYF